MSPVALLAVALLGGVGASGRVLLDGVLTRRASTPFPVGILVVNLLGAFAAGLVAGFAMTGDARRLIATGLLGGFTTFSTWMLQTDRLAAQRHRRLAIANVVAAGALGLVAVWLGRRIGLALDA